MEDGGADGAGIMGAIDLRTPGGSLAAADLTDSVHLLPCSIKRDGPCPVSHYFTHKKTDAVVDDMPVEEAFFRGRNLQGLTLSLPEGYRGYILEKKKYKSGNSSYSLEGGFNQWVSRAEFGNLTYWNHDSVPSSDDPLLRCFHWFSVADAIINAVIPFLSNPSSQPDLTLKKNPIMVAQASHPRRIGFRKSSKQK